MLNQIFQNIIFTLSKYGMDYKLYDHQPVYTIEQACKVCDSLPAQNVKVLFVQADKPQNNFDYYLIVCAGNKKMDFQKIANLIGAKEIKLAPPEEVKKKLGVEIGALSPFGYQKNYPIILDQDLFKQSVLFINPGLNDKTIKLKSKDFQTLIECFTSVY